MVVTDWQMPPAPHWTAGVHPVIQEAYRRLAWLSGCREAKVRDRHAAMQAVAALDVGMGIMRAKT